VKHPRSWGVSLFFVIVNGVPSCTFCVSRQRRDSGHKENP